MPEGTVIRRQVASASVDGKGFARPYQGVDDRDGLGRRRPAIVAGG